MGLSQIHDDLMHLAGRMPHRSAQSEHEREAANYIQERMRQYTPDTAMETFHAPQSYPELFAAYLAEFLFVGLIAAWSPSLAFGYGLGVFLLYLAEFCGYRGLSRFLPQYPSQNVVARFLGTRPRCIIVVAAYYDSGSATPLTSPDWVPWLRRINLGLVACMVIVLATCVVDSFTHPDASGFATAVLRWTSILALATGALCLYVGASQSEDIRGANSNASGVAALLGLAEKLSAEPLEEADVWLAATGSHEAWMAGMRSFLSEHTLDRSTTCILNLESVGRGTLHYLRTEGFAHALQADPEMLKLAEVLRVGRPVRAGVLRAIPTEAHVPLMRNMRAMTLMGLERDGLPPQWNQVSDRVNDIDDTGIAETVEFSELLIRRLAEQHALKHGA